MIVTDYGARLNRQRPRAGHLEQLDPTAPRPGTEFEPGAIGSPLQATDERLREAEARLLDNERCQSWQASLRMDTDGSIQAFQVDDGVPYNHLSIGFLAKDDIPFFVAVCFGRIGQPGKVEGIVKAGKTTFELAGGPLVVVATISTWAMGSGEVHLGTTQAPCYVIAVPMGTPGDDVEVAVTLTQSFRL